jgi:hypothetical protein
MTDIQNPSTASDAPAPKAKRSTKTAPKSKTAIVAAMLTRAGGTTRPEILKATGWPTVSVQAIAKAAGLKLKMAKKAGEPTVYSAPAPKPAKAKKG